MAIQMVPKPQRPAERLLTAAKEMVSIAKGESEPASIYVGPGRPSQDKQLISLRLSREVIEKFRATGPGWQARINEALKRAIP